MIIIDVNIFLKFKMQNKVIFKYLRRTIQNFKVPFKPPKIAVYL